jgi:hypothetical protein
MMYLLSPPGRVTLAGLFIAVAAVRVWSAAKRLRQQTSSTQPSTRKER